jgi:hypothetical protein
VRSTAPARKPLASQPDRAVRATGVPSLRAGGAAVRPQVVLHVGSSPESLLVFELLEQAGIDFRAVPSRRAVPLATFGRLRFRGLAAARNLVDMLHELDATWLAEAKQAMPDVLDSPDSTLMADVENARARWRQQARAVLARVQAESGHEKPTRTVLRSSRDSSSR